MKDVKEIIDTILDTEGGKFTNDPADSGGKTKWGWTEKALRSAGWTGDVEDLDRETAFNLYYSEFYRKTGYEEVQKLSIRIAAELMDTAVNNGVGTAGRFLQVCLNAFNNGGTYYPDVQEDGSVGRGTLRALSSFLEQRGSEGEGVLLAALNALQIARYIELSAKYPKNERYVYGWIKNRGM